MDIDIIDPSPTEAALLFQHPLDGLAMLLQSRARDKDVVSKKRGCVVLPISYFGTKMIINRLNKIYNGDTMDRISNYINHSKFDLLINHNTSPTPVRILPTGFDQPHGQCSSGPFGAAAHGRAASLRRSRTSRFS